MPSKASSSAKSPPKAKEEVDIGLPGNKRAGVNALLNVVLADQHILYQKTRNFHWNLVGHRFYTLHELFEKQYRELSEVIDQTAERIRMLGGTAPGSMSEMLKLGTLKEDKGELIHGDAAIERLAGDHEAAASALREAVSDCEDKFDDAGTADLLTGFMREHEKAAWMLRSHLI